MENGDIYKRKQIEQDAYQCGCRWERWPDVGDVLVQCPIHQAHTNASVEKFERERERAKKVPNAQVQAGPAGVMAGIAPATDCWAETTGKE